MLFIWQHFDLNFIPFFIVDTVVSIYNIIGRPIPVEYFNLWLAYIVYWKFRLQSSLTHK